MAKSQYLEDMQNAILTATQQQDALEGSVKLYGVAQPSEAQLYHAKAHAALDAILDAQRAKHISMLRAIREAGDNLD